MDCTSSWKFLANTPESKKRIQFSLFCILCHTFGPSTFSATARKHWPTISNVPTQTYVIWRYTSPGPWLLRERPFQKNTKNWHTIDALGTILAIFTILDTFTKLLQYYYNTLFHPIIPLIHPPSEFHTVEQCLVRSFGLPVKHDRRVVHSLNIGWACVSANDTDDLLFSCGFSSTICETDESRFLGHFSNNCVTIIIITIIHLLIVYQLKLSRSVVTRG